MIFSRRGRPTKLRLDYELIESLVPDGAKVLDLGCGDGQLLSDLIEHKHCVGRGIEIDETAVLECVRRGVPVYHGDMLEGMSFYRDGEFDVTILSQTLQQVMKPPEAIREMLRVVVRDHQFPELRALVGEARAALDRPHAAHGPAFLPLVQYAQRPPVHD